MRVEYAGALNRRNGGGDLRNLFRISTFAEVGYAFDESGHLRAKSRDARTGTRQQFVRSLDLRTGISQSEYMA